MDATQTLLATLGATLAGGRHAFRITDETVKSAARETVAVSRAARRRSAARERYNLKKAAKRAERFTVGYSLEDLARIDSLFAIWSKMPRRKTLRDAWKAILHDSANCPNCVTSGDRCEKAQYPANWRILVRAYSLGKRESESVGQFAIVNDDMRMGAGNRFYRNIQMHWHRYYGGRHYSVNGATPDDVMQDAFLNAIENGDTVDGIPTFGAMYMHARMAVESSPFRYTLLTRNNTVPEWNWENDIPESMSIHEYLAFDAYREYVIACKNATAHWEAQRAERATMLNDARNSLYALINSGMTVRRIASILGRTVEGILADIENDGSAPATVWHSAPITESDRKNAIAARNAESEYVNTLRIIELNRITDWYANGRVFQAA